MTPIYFISAERLKEASYIQDNVDQKVIEPTILKCQDLYIHPILGTELYQAFKTKITANNDLSSETDYKLLLEEYIQPCLVQFITAEVLIYNTYKIANKAVLSKSSDNSQPLSINDIWKIRDDLKSTGEFYAKRLEEYLCANTNLFPEYISQTRSDALYPSGANYEVGIWLGSSGCGC